jgi:hypothetical protein
VYVLCLESKKLWGVALDVFEGEKKYIFHDKSKVSFLLSMANIQIAHIEQIDF